MVERLRIGKNVGQQGYFLSRPGDDVTAPEQSMLLDSRFVTMNVHVAGRKVMSSYEDVGNHARLYFTTVTFPSLGYRPMYWASVVYINANSIGVPPQTAYYPGSWGTQRSMGYGGTMGAASIIDENGIWLEDDATLRCKVWVRSSSMLNIHLSYVILRNREETA